MAARYYDFDQFRLTPERYELTRAGRPGPSYRNILRAGFEPSYARPSYRSPATPTA